MRIGLFGGSFDPIHRGHTETVAAAAEELGLDRIVYLPTAAPPHKPGREFAPATARLAMVELALLDREDAWVSPFELTPGRPAYTIDTVEHFQREQPADDFVLLIGGDSFAQLDSWRRWRDLVRQVSIAVLIRPGWRLEEIAQPIAPDVLALARDRAVRFVENPPIAVSATDLRRRFREGSAPPEGALAPLVLKYIRKYSLYR